MLLATLATVLSLVGVQLYHLSQLALYNEPGIPPFLEPGRVSMRSRRLRFVPITLESEEKNTAAVKSQSELQKDTPASVATPPPPPPKRYAVVNLLVDNSEDASLWGIYSIHTQMKRLKMLPRISHVVLVSSDTKKQYKMLLRKWLGGKHVIEIDTTSIRDCVPKDVAPNEFNKVAYFNLTQYDKIITLDDDILVRTDITSWFDYPAPAATQVQSSLEWSSGAMVIEPNSELFSKLLEYVPKFHKWGNARNDKGTDGNNVGNILEKFLSSFFLRDISNYTMYTMSYGSSVLSTDLIGEKKDYRYEYYWMHQNDAIETVRFALDKPWSNEIVKGLGSPVSCGIMREWLKSVENAPTDTLRQLPDIQQKCPVPVEELLAGEILQKKKKKAKRNLELARIRKAAKLAGNVTTSTRAPPKSSTSDICFVSSFYGTSINVPPDVSVLKNHDFVGSSFYLFTDKDDVNVPGWTNILRQFDYKRDVTKSRWVKYLAWKEPFIENCGIVYFVEGGLSPRANKTIDFLDLTDSILDSTSGFAQNRARHRKVSHTLLAELKYAARTRKDATIDIETAAEWFQKQPDFGERNHCAIYDTVLIGYAPKSTQFQAAATFFWDRYSREEDISYDSPLWSYTVSRFGLDPLLLGGKRRDYFAKIETSENSAIIVQ